MNHILTSDNRDKESRRAAIRRIVLEQKISTQNELSECLMKEGFQVTQATVSRDIRELHLVKISDNKGHYYYAAAQTQNTYHASDKFKSIYRSSVAKVDRAINLVVIRTMTGMAQAVCATMDGIDWPDVIGTIAGDDTVLIIAKDEDAAIEVVNVLKSI